MKEVLQKLNQIQTKLKAPKGQFNSFGKYKYRNAEDILEALKPHLAETRTVLNIRDEVKQIGDRFYIEATATLYDVDSSESITATASAREADVKKGMDESQITGATSSYARKYALNGLFAIDDTKDADSQDNSQSGGFSERHRKQIDSITSVTELRTYYAKNKGLGKEFTDYITARSKQLEDSHAGTGDGRMEEGEGR